MLADLVEIAPARKAGRVGVDENKARPLGARAGAPAQDLIAEVNQP